MKRKYSLKRNKEFRYVYRTGKSVSCKCLVLVYRKNNTGLLRVGFSVSKKIGNSVMRNRIKRRLRSAFDEVLPTVNSDYNIIVIARTPIRDSTYAQICESLNYLLKKSKLVPNESDTANGDSQHCVT